jgi:hypothetical protein
MLGLLLRVSLGLLSVISVETCGSAGSSNEIQLTLGLEQLVNLGRCETSQELFGHGVLQSALVTRATHALGLPVLLTVPLVCLHRFEAGGPTDELMGKLGLVLLIVGVDIVNLVASASVVVEKVEEAHCEEVVWLGKESEGLVKDE